jgi:hypothetical protein
MPKKATRKGQPLTADTRGLLIKLHAHIFAQTRNMDMEMVLRTSDP